ncbi:DnaT-like ssDNA-binding protein [Cupriavidus sp. 2TAF22]|uniref:DnaT-like ssDNA-binding protein n=1 Tax=unclassified Cupriavidus TaxID=2640874 RepID=UPI003F8F6B49
MAIVVEDGTGKPDANSYVSVAEADAYHADRGNTAWASATAKEAKLINATAYADSMYRFQGQAAGTTQALEWPRAGVTGIPKRVKDAVCELALRALAGPLAADVKPDQVTETTVGPITKKYGAQRNDGRVRYPLVDGLLRPLLLVTGGNVPLLRV